MRWELKTSFHMLMRAKDERLAELTPSYDEASGALAIRRNGARLVSAHAGGPAGRAQLGAFFADVLTGGHHGTPRFVEGAGFYFGNIEAPVISLINLASVRALAGPAGGEVDRRRFRANVYVDGPAPWAERAWVERAWVGRTLRLGAVLCRVVHETIRCGATTVNPATCARDLNVPKILEKAYDHMFCGVYLAALDGGEIGVGAPVGLE